MCSLHLRKDGEEGSSESVPCVALGWPLLTLGRSLSPFSKVPTALIPESASLLLALETLSQVLHLVARIGRAHMRLSICTHPFPLQHQLHEVKDLVVCFLGSSSTQNSAWAFTHRAGAHKWSSNPTPGHISGKDKNSNSKRHMHPSVHSSTIYSSQDMEAT